LCSLVWWQLDILKSEPRAGAGSCRSVCWLDGIKGDLNHAIVSLGLVFHTLFGYFMLSLDCSNICFASQLISYQDRFATRCYAMASCSICPSIRLSRLWILSKRVICQNESSSDLRLCSLSGSHTILVFLYQTAWQYSDGDPS